MHSRKELNRSTQLGKSGSADGAASYRKTGGLVPCRSRLRPAIFSFTFPIARNYLGKGLVRTIKKQLGLEDA
jgi:hypothetical protein